MNKIMEAVFPSTDYAEYAAAYLQQHVPHIAQVKITPRYPESLRLSGQMPIHFSIYTTAAVSAHNITGRIERPMTAEEILEPKRDQTADLHLLYRAESQKAIQNIITALGGNHVKTWEA